MYLYRLPSSESDWLAIYVENVKEDLLSKANYPFEEMSLECRLLFGSCALLFDYIASHCNTDQIKLTKRGSLVLDYSCGQSVQHIKIPTSLIPKNEAFRKQEQLWYQATEEFLQKTEQTGKLLPSHNAHSKECSESVKSERQPNLGLINNLMNYQICSKHYRLENQKEEICQTDFKDIPLLTISRFQQNCEDWIVNKQAEEYSFKAGDWSSQKDANFSSSSVHFRQDPQFEDILPPNPEGCSNSSKQNVILEDSSKHIPQAQKSLQAQLDKKEVAIEQNSRKTPQSECSNESQNLFASQLMQSNFNEEIATAKLRLSKMEELYQEQMISNFKIKGDLASIHSQLQDVFRIIACNTFQQGSIKPIQVKSTDRPTSLYPVQIDPHRNSSLPKSKLNRKWDKIKRKSAVNREDLHQNQDIFCFDKKLPLKYEYNHDQNIDSEPPIESQKANLDIYAKDHEQRLEKSSTANLLQIHLKN